MKQLISALIILFVVLNYSFAQKDKIKFGKIDKADLEMTRYVLDSTAKAVILYDKGDTDLAYNTSVGFQYTFNRHLRIKILDKRKFDLADFSIPLYNDSEGREKLVKFTGITHTMKKGKVEETKVNKGDLFKEVISDNQTKMTIAMPKVEEGSIIEIKYSILSPFYWSLHDWQYQHEIPVRYSEYQISYPEWFNYKTKFKGYDTGYISELELDSDFRDITFNSVQRTGVYSISSKHTSNKVNYQRLKFGWIAENMPAFVKEEYISSVNNYLVKVTFELSSTNFPNSPWKSYLTNWDALGKTMLESNNFGKQLSKGKIKFLATEAKAIASSNAALPEQAAAIFYHLKNKVAWNGNNGIFTTGNLKEAYAKGKGNVAEVNLLLVGMLRQAGLAADPVLLSTKKHGFLNPSFPSLSQFNYVIAKVNFPDGTAGLLDATQQGLSIDLLPIRCLNEKGLIINENGIGWANLQPKGKYRVTRSLKLALNEDMEWTGNMKTRCTDYAASSMRYTYNRKENEADYISYLESEHEGMNIGEYLVEGIDKIGKGVKESFEVNYTNQIMDGGDLLYFNPMLTYGLQENPFNLKERSYPVDFRIPQIEVHSLEYKIPEGYEIDEIPENLIIALPEKGGSFSYTAKIQKNKIYIISQYKINKHLFLPNEYQALKEFYNIMIAKHSEQVVLKKA